LGCTVAELLERLDSYELTEWMAYEALEPFGEERADMRAGIIASTIANVNRGKGQKPFSPTDFMPFSQGASEEQQLADTRSALMALKSQYKAVKGTGSVDGSQ
jgi:hypothetical protein